MDCPACHHPNVDGARFCAKCGAPLPAAAPSEADPLIGTIVGGRFRITGILGEGGMGRVYSGEQQMGTNVRKVAVKTLLSQFAKDPQTHARFMRECGTVSELEHPNTIKVYDFGQTPTGELYIAMELLTGKSVEATLEGGPLSPERVDKILGQVCGSLQEAHEKGIVHRDLKPANIQLSTRAGEDDYVKVLDFGIAKRSEAKDAKQEQKLTQQGTILGTPPYMSPEQFMGKELDARSDIYSLGVIAYEMLTGRLPFEADTPWQWATQHMTAQPFPFETIPIAASVPAKMKAAIMRALHKDREKRQQSVREFFEELTLGATRLSLRGMRAASGSFPDQPAGGGTTAMPASMPGTERAGHTQVGEPLFVGGAPQAAGKTMVDQAPLPSGAPAVSAVPTGGGQTFPAPPPPKKGGSGPIIAVVAVVGVIAVVGGVLLMRGRGKPTDRGGDTIALPSGAPATSVASDPPATDGGAAATDDGGASPVASGKTTPTPTGTGTGKVSSADAEGDKECDAAIGLATGTNTAMALSHYRSCKGPKQAAARAAIDAAASREVARKGCGAKAIAMSAAAIGAGSAKAALASKHCK